MFIHMDDTDLREIVKLLVDFAPFRSGYLDANEWSWSKVTISTMKEIDPTYIECYSINELDAETLWPVVVEYDGKIFVGSLICTGNDGIEGMQSIVEMEETIHYYDIDDRKYLQDDDIDADTLAKLLQENQQFTLYSNVLEEAAMFITPVVCKKAKKLYDKSHIANRTCDTCGEFNWNGEVIPEGICPRCREIEEHLNGKNNSI